MKFSIVILIEKESNHEFVNFSNAESPRGTPHGILLHSYESPFFAFH